MVAPVCALRSWLLLSFVRSVHHSSFSLCTLVMIVLLLCEYESWLLLFFLHPGHDGCCWFFATIWNTGRQCVKIFKCTLHPYSPDTLLRSGARCSSIVRRSDFFRSSFSSSIPWGKSLFCLCVMRRLDSFRSSNNFTIRWRQHLFRHSLCIFLPNISFFLSASTSLYDSPHSLAPLCAYIRAFVRVHLFVFVCIFLFGLVRYSSYIGGLFCAIQTTRVYRDGKISRRSLFWRASLPRILKAPEKFKHIISENPFVTTDRNGIPSW